MIKWTLFISSDANFKEKSVAKKQHVEYMQQYLHACLNIYFTKD